jgi:NTP pyrophosphatase (non-canonical NTP hydrolase)
MTFEEYQRESRKTARYPEIHGNKFIYPAMGVAGEAGEFMEKVKKMFRDDDGILTEKRKDEIVKELGDIMWYISQVCTDLGIDLEEVPKQNLEKLMSRMERNVLNGDGDYR